MNGVNKQEEHNSDIFEKPFSTTKNHWYVLRCRKGREKKSAADLEALGMHVYLPVKKVLRQWSDRKKTLKVPLIPSYLFLYSNEDERKLAFTSTNIQSFLVNHGRLAVVREREINVLREFETYGSVLRINKLDYHQGRKVMIERGPFKGYYGHLKDNHGKSKFLVELESLDYQVELDVRFENLAYI